MYADFGKYLIENFKWHRTRISDYFHEKCKLLALRIIIFLVATVLIDARETSFNFIYADFGTCQNSNFKSQ